MTAEQSSRPPHLDEINQLPEVYGQVGEEFKDFPLKDYTLGRSALEAHEKYVDQGREAQARLAKLEAENEDPDEVWFLQMDHQEEQSRAELRLRHEVISRLTDVQSELKEVLKTDDSTHRVVTALEVRNLPQQILDDFAAESVADLLSSLANANISADEADRTKLLHFLRWHNEQRAAEERHLTETWLPQHIERMTNRISTAVNEGHLPSVVLEQQMRYTKNPDLYHVWADDIFVPKPGPYAYASRKHDGRAYINLESFDGGPNSEHSRDAFMTHENSHLEMGRPNRAQEASETPEADLLPSETSLYQIFPGDAVLIMEEAVVTQLEDGLLHGNFEVIDPDAPERSHARSGAYHGCRKLLSVLPVSFYEIVGAASSDDPEIARQVAQKIDDALPGLNVRQRIADLPMEYTMTVGVNADRAAGELADAISKEMAAA